MSFLRLPDSQVAYNTNWIRHIKCDDDQCTLYPFCKSSTYTVTFTKSQTPNDYNILRQYIDPKSVMR